MPTPVILAAFILATAFCVVGLLVQREHDMQRRISAQVDRNRTVHALQTAQVARTPIIVPMAGVLDGGAPLPAVALVSHPDDAPRFSDFAEDTDTPSIPDEVVIGQIGDIAEQPTQIIPAVEMSAIAAATAAREQVPPQILEALGARWLLAMPWILPDDARN